MPLYFFDTNVGDLLHRDDVGHEARDDEAARRLALDALPDLARDAMPDNDNDKFSVTVRDSHGDVIYDASLTLKAVWRPQPAQGTWSVDRNHSPIVNRLSG